MKKQIYYIEAQERSKLLMAKKIAYSRLIRGIVGSMWRDLDLLAIFKYSSLWRSDKLTHKCLLKLIQGSFYR